VTTFSADWLDLREPYDLRARSPAVLAALGAALADRGSIAIVDLACGTGATSRAIASRLPRRQRWRLVDNDPALLARAAASAPAGGQEIVTALIDIAHELEAALEEPVDLVATSALLDLVSAEWLARLAMEIAGRSLLVYAALSYDGRIMFEPADPFDSEMTDAVNRHQRGDKGFGPALGPTSAGRLIARLDALGYAIVQGPSDWNFGPLDHEIQADLLAGWAAAARESGDLASAEIDGWHARRRHHIALGRSSIRVGHIDFFARPTVAR
jgi:SAM-dependent methyltransferase